MVGIVDETLFGIKEELRWMINNRADIPWLTRMPESPTQQPPKTETAEEVSNEEEAEPEQSKDTLF